ncbi:MAG: hypothetical protein H6721_16385 [Sandaracinus sp.]|nr:hypothetical protein [Sandaracinus sp.]MCB9623213.1 hypothetical protein [Sandaracinus sp.]MCB9633697.1 hypothetical protein [Sandaracinus sp.]
MTEPPAPETLFAEYRALAARADATLADWQALQKRVRAAKAAWTKRGDSVRRQQLTDLQGYVTRTKPAEPRALTPATLAREVSELRAAMRSGRAQEAAATVRRLWQQLAATRSRRLEEPAYDDDHDELLDGESALVDIAEELGVLLDAD